MKFVKIVLVFLFINISLFAKDSSVRNYFLEESLTGKILERKEVNKYGFSWEDINTQVYIGLLVSSSNINVDRQDSPSAVTLNETIKKDAISYSLELGYVYTSQIDFLLNYQYSDFSNISLSNTYISSLYYINYENLRPYMGINLGMSTLTWDNKTANTVNNDLKSSSYLVGLNLGSVYKIDENYSLNFNYQGNFLNHKTSIEVFPNETVLKHNFIQSIGFGLRYSF